MDIIINGEINEFIFKLNEGISQKPLIILNEFFSLEKKKREVL